MWDVTTEESRRGQKRSISTHTSRVGCDAEDTETIWYCENISTHTSRVGCDNSHGQLKQNKTFLLTHPVWDVTSIVTAINTLLKNFYSHIPCGM